MTENIREEVERKAMETIVELKQNEELALFAEELENQNNF